MADQKLTYKVEADTSGAVRSLDQLGDAGEKAGKQIGDGFDDASSKSKAAIAALSAQLDKVESDAKATAAAVSAIKANLTVDVDDSKVAGFVSDIRNKMGVAFDDITADAKQFADVLERGVNMDRTRGEIHAVGDELDHTRGEADQSRSVFANMVGNTTQDLGELGGVVGTLGVGMGQLGEYAADGTISLQGLASMAGPMALLAAAGAGVQSVMKNIAETKAFNVNQVKAFSDAFAELGNTSLALSTSLDGVFNARVDNDSLWGQLTGAQKTEDLADNLAKVGVTLSDIDRIIRSGASDTTSFQALVDVQNLDAILQDANLSLDDYNAIMDAVRETTFAWTTSTQGAADAAKFFGTSLSDVNAIIENQLVAEDPFTRFNQGLFQTGGHVVDLQAIWNDVVRDMADDDASFDTTAGNIDVLSEAMGLSTDKVIELAREQSGARDSAADYEQAQSILTTAIDGTTQALNDQASAIQADMDKQQEMIDGAKSWADSQQDFRDATADLPQMLAETNTAIANNLSGTEAYTDAVRTQRDETEGWVDQLVATRIEFDKGEGRQRTAIQTQHDYAEGLGRVAGKLNGDVIPAVARYYANVLKIPDDKITDFQMVLASGDQEEIETFIEENSGTFDASFQAKLDQAKALAVAIALAKLAATREALVNPEVVDAGDAAAAIAGLTRPRTVEITPVVNSIALIALAARIAQAVSAASRGTATAGARSVAPPTPAPSTARAGFVALDAELADDDVAAFEAPAAVAVSAPSLVWGPTSFPAAPARHVDVTVNVSAGVIGNRFDVQRAVTRAVRSAARIGGALVPA